MHLKIDTKTIHHVNAFDLDSFIEKTYGVEYAFAASQESGNDTSHEFYVDGEVDEWDQETVDNILQGEWENYSASAMLNYMAKQGLIPNGDYVIRVCW